MGKDRDYFQEYFEKMAKLQQELNNGDPEYSGGYKSLHAGQALLYGMAASAASKAEAAEKQAEKNRVNLRAVAIGFIVIAVIHLPEIVIWFEANWDKVFP